MGGGIARGRHAGLWISGRTVAVLDGCSPQKSGQVVGRLVRINKGCNGTFWGYSGTLCARGSRYMGMMSIGRRCRARGRRRGRIRIPVRGIKEMGC